MLIAAHDFTPHSIPLRYSTINVTSLQVRMRIFTIHSDSDVNHTEETFTAETNISDQHSESLLSNTYL